MATAKKKRSTPPALARKRTLAAKRGWQTRRENVRAREKQHKKRSLAAKKGARTSRAKTRAREALQTFQRAVEAKVREQELSALRRSWRRSKRELFEAVDDEYDRYLAILDDIADESGTEWDIAYGPEESAA